MNTTFAHMPHLSESAAIRAARGVSLRPKDAGVSVGWQTQARGGYMHNVAVGALSTTADDVHNAKLTLDTQMMATNRQWELAGLGNASNNPTFTQLAANDYPSWDAFYQTWNSFAIEDSSFLGASDDMARLTDYSNQLAAWQARLVTDTKDSPGGAMTPILKAAVPTTPDKTDTLGVDSTLTRVGVIAGFILLGILAIEVAPAILPHHYRYRRA